MIREKPKYNEKQLWQKYSMLTDEMKKFLEKNDIDQFLELQKQRDQFDKMIAEEPEKSYIKSEEGQILLKKLIFLNKAIHITGQQWLNGTRMNHNVGHSYEALGQVTSGRRIDGKM